MPDKKWVIQSALLYAAIAAVVTAILAIQDTPGQNPGRFTCDQMRPFLAGFAAMAAVSAWNWVSGDAVQTWAYTKYWACSFLVTQLAGVLLLISLGSLSVQQGNSTLIGILVGAAIGLLRVLNALSKNERIDF